jgi:hypothetical protein
MPAKSTSVYQRSTINYQQSIWLMVDCSRISFAVIRQGGTCKYDACKINIRLSTINYQQSIWLMVDG